MSQSLDDFIFFESDRVKKDPFALDEGEGGHPVEWGDAKELRQQVVSLLAQLLNRAHTDMKPELACLSDAWPYTRMGLDLLKAMRICDRLAELHETEPRKQTVPNRRPAGKPGRQSH